MLFIFDKSIIVQESLAKIVRNSLQVRSVWLLIVRPKSGSLGHNHSFAKKSLQSQLLLTWSSLNVLNLLYFYKSDLLSFCHKNV